jgi:catechol 2,3-dioxygenase-like lactoylglutathione lyase family enzyme
MITGFHTIIFSDDAESTREFFRDVLGWPAVDAGGGWLIFKTPPTEMGVHPTVSEGGERWATIPHAQLSVMCDDLPATIAELRGKGVEVAEDIRNEGFGLVTEIEVPGAGTMMLYQPLHPVAYEIDG